MIDFRPIAAATLLAAFSAVPAEAQLAAPAQSVEIGSSVTQNAQVDNLISVAIGQDTYSNASQCAIYEGTKVGGSVNQKCRADNIISVAIGQRSSSFAVQGGISVPKGRH